MGVLKRSQISKKEQKGITLIALTVTIIILLVLAGISITMLMKKNGILKKASDAKKETEDSTILEEMSMIYLEALAEEKTKNVSVKEYMQQELDNKGYQGAYVGDDEKSIIYNAKKYDIINRKVEEIIAQHTEITNIEGNIPAYKYYSNIAGRGIATLKKYKGKIFMGLGDYSVNTGNTKVLYYDTVSNSIGYSGTIADEAIERFEILDDKLYTTGCDPTEAWGIRKCIFI